uniref:Reverse transcriptase domain-containing protein n=1 Tax=Tanacetum cinerariifolium TaxID=118510 RepID=A0A6L2K656_TANCI|nr:hypothetical protein [Tanacetum cinerariifolium]
MCTRYSSNLHVESPPNPSTSNPKLRNRGRSKKPFILEESPVDTMADQHTMAELLRAPTEGYVEAIVVKDNKKKTKSEQNRTKTGSVEKPGDVKNRSAFYNNGEDDDEDYAIAITPDFLTTDSLIMGDEHLDTIPEKESDEFIKSSVENLITNPNEFEDECECDVPDCDDSQMTIFLTFSNSLFDDSTSSDDESSHGEIVHDDPIPLPDTLDFSNDVRVFLPFFTYPVTFSNLLSSGSEDTIFDPGFYHFSSLEPSVPHRGRTFMKFNIYPNHLNESPMEILSSTCSPMEQ